MIGGETLAPSQPILQVVTQHEVEFFVVEAIMVRQKAINGGNDRARAPRVDGRFAGLDSCAAARARRGALAVQRQQVRHQAGEWRWINLFQPKHRKLQDIPRNNIHTVRKCNPVPVEEMTVEQRQHHRCNACFDPQRFVVRREFFRQRLTPVTTARVIVDRCSVRFDVVADTASMRQHALQQPNF